MINDTSHARVGAFQAIGHGFRAGVRHWRWMSLSALFALGLGYLAALPMVRQLKTSLGYNPSGASSDLGDQLQGWVETLRAFAAHPNDMNRFAAGLVACAVAAWLLKVWLGGALVASVRSGRGLRFAELVRLSNAGFWPQLKQSLLFVAVFVVFALPPFFTFKWVQAVRKTAIAAASVEQANLIFYGVALVCLVLFAVWFELARASLANMPGTTPRVRSTLKQGWKTLLKRPLASVGAFVLFFALGLVALALLTEPLAGLHNAWASALAVAASTIAGSVFRAMRLESLARVVR